MLSVSPLLPSAVLSRSLNYTDTDSERTNARVSAYLPVGFNLSTTVPFARPDSMVQLHTEGRLLVQIGSYNTNLQGGLGLPQDLVDWLSPTLQVSSFLSRQPRAPDLVAVGFQELLPLHLGRPC